MYLGCLSLMGIEALTLSFLLVFDIISATSDLLVFSVILKFFAFDKISQNCITLALCLIIFGHKVASIAECTYISWKLCLLYRVHLISDIHNLNILGRSFCSKGVIILPVVISYWECTHSICLWSVFIISVIAVIVFRCVCF